MSDAKASNAKLVGWDGPHFPHCIDLLQTAWNAAPLQNGCTLQEMARAAPSFTARSERPRTTDGYAWFWSAEFSARDGRILIVFPWSQDWAKKDGTQSDRHVSLYTKGAPGQSETDEIVCGFIGQLNAARAQATRAA